VRIVAERELLHSSGIPIRSGRKHTLRFISVEYLLRVSPFVLHVGKTIWAGRSRLIWFAGGFQREGCQAAVSLLRANSKAVVFKPTDLGAGLWQEAIGNLVIRVELVKAIDSATLKSDVEDIQASIEDAIALDIGKRAPTKTKRSHGAANI
jgi:hypothetical protein